VLRLHRMWAWSVCLLVVACDRDAPGRPLEEPKVAAAPVARDEAPAVPVPVRAPPEVESTLRLPTDMQLPGLATVARATSWEQRIAGYPERQQDYLRAKNDMYFGALQFASAEEQEKLVAQGFPMPEEWLAAQSLPDGELERLATQGNRKAQMFLVDRAVDDVGPVLKERGLGDSPEDREMFRRFSTASATAAMLLLNTCSPFAAYQSGVLLASGTLGHDPAMAAGSFLAARDLGDTRADTLSRAFFIRHRQIDAQTALASYASFKPARCKRS
jgi:hypothetical protein